jgi:hypothetical protein
MADDKGGYGCTLAIIEIVVGVLLFLAIKQLEVLEQIRDRLPAVQATQETKP